MKRILSAIILISLLSCGIPPPDPVAVLARNGHQCWRYLSSSEKPSEEYIHRDREGFICFDHDGTFENVMKYGDGTMPGDYMRTRDTAERPGGLDNCIIPDTTWSVQGDSVLIVGGGRSGMRILDSNRILLYDTLWADSVAIPDTLVAVSPQALSRTCRSTVSEVGRILTGDGNRYWQVITYVPQFMDKQLYYHFDTDCIWKLLIRNRSGVLEEVSSDKPRRWHVINDSTLAIGMWVCKVQQFQQDMVIINYEDRYWNHGYPSHPLRFTDTLLSYSPTKKPVDPKLPPALR